MTQALVDFERAAAPPGMRLYAIGDVHGRRDLLVAMHEAIDAEISRDKPSDWRIIHVGDYADRGPDTKGVIDFIIDRAGQDARIVSLRGNHDEGMLNFLERKGDWRSFSHYGGDTAAASYGVEADFSPEEIEATRRALCEAVPAAHIGFLRSLPMGVSFGDFFFCHAGIRPGIAIDAQDREDLMWIRETFHRHAALYEKVIVHGHTPVPRAEIHPNRVNIDTRAFASGLLTALVIEDAEKRIVEIGPDQRTAEVTP